MLNDIEYLNIYRAALEHQRTHGSSLTSLYGAPQPGETCIECLKEHRPMEDRGHHYIKKQFSWAVPTPAALLAIQGHSPRGVVEIGAGGGYWAMLLRQLGVDVVAYDPHPAGKGNDFAGHQWSEVLVGDQSSVIGHPDRTLLLCWPSYSEPWTGDAVDLYDGDTVIYIGEPPGGCTGDDRMHALLGDTPYCPHYSEPCTCAWPAAKFKEVESRSIPQWFGLHDALFVYERISGDSGPSDEVARG